MHLLFSAAGARCYIDAKRATRLFPRETDHPSSVLDVPRSRCVSAFAHLSVTTPENHTMMKVESIEAIEPLHLAILELGRRYEAGEISRERRDARLVELNKRRPASRRRRARALSLTIPAPITFYALDEAHA